MAKRTTRMAFYLVFLVACGQGSDPGDTSSAPITSGSAPSASTSIPLPSASPSTSAELEEATTAYCEDIAPLTAIVFDLHNIDAANHLDSALQLVQIARPALTMAEGALTVDALRFTLLHDDELSALADGASDAARKMMRAVDGDTLAKAISEMVVPVPEDALCASAADYTLGYLDGWFHHERAQGAAKAYSRGYKRGTGETWRPPGFS